MLPIRRSLLATVVALLAAPLLPAQEPKLPPNVKKVAVADGVELHYVEKGKGVPVVLIHAGGADYSLWGPYVDAFAESYRAIAYSCRYNYPNTNKVQPNYSLIVAAEDLAGLIQKLDLGKVHVAGYSLGGQTALHLALKHPELVRTLTLCDPGVHFKGDKLGEVALPGIRAARAAYEKGKTEEALEVISEGPAGRRVKLAEMPEVFRKVMMRNAGEIEALVKGDMFPEMDREAVKKIEVPVLLMFGEKSWPVFKSIEEELTRALPEKNRKLVIIQGGSHAFAGTHAKVVQKEILEFLSQQPADGQPVRPVTRPVISEEVAPLEAIAPVAKDGTKGEAFLRKPPGDGPFPAVVLVHGGITKWPTAPLKEHALGTWTSRFLAAGYVVADTTYRSRDVDLQSRDSLEDVLATIEHVRKLPYVDAKSIVVNGTSGGGDLALSVAAETDVAVIVPEEPASMLFLGMANKNMPKKGERYIPQDGPPYFGTDPKRWRLLYTPECQKLTRDKIAKMRCPILIIQGDLQWTNQFNAELLLPELKSANKTVEVFTYKGEPHSFAFYSNPQRTPHPDVARKAFEDVDGYLRKLLKTKPVPIDPKLVKQVPIETK